MENTTTNFDTALLWFAGLFFGILIIVGIAMYLSERFKDINYAKMELCRAYDEDEYRYWHRELTICRLSLIPFMSYEKAKRIVRFFSRGRHAKKEKHNDGLTSLLLPSFLGIIICAVCLAGGTFAWFTASQTTATQTIQAASYTVAAEISDEDGTPIATGNTVSLQKGTYTVKLTANGDATTGYCIVEVGETEIYRQQLKPPESYEFTFVANESTSLTVEYRWGTAATPHSSIQDGTYTYGNVNTATVNTEEEEKATEQETNPTEVVDENNNIYTVVSGDTLTAIATKYNTSIEKLIAYNELADTNIKAGQKIKIPPTDFEISKAETPTESSPTDTEQTNNITESDKTNSNTSN